MIMKLASITFPLGLFLMLSFPVSGQQPNPLPECTRNESLEDCEKKINIAISATAFAQVGKDASAALDAQIRAMVPSEVALAMVGEAPATNFLDRLGLSVATRNLEGSEQALAVSYVLGNESTKIELLVRNAEVAGKILEKIPQGSRAERAKELGKQIDDLDHIEISLSWRPQTPTFGRQRGDEMLHSLWDSVTLAELTKPAPATPPSAAEEILRGFRECVERSRNPEEPEGIAMGDLFGAQFDTCRPKIEAFFAQEGRRILRNLTRFKEVATHYPALILGQPELVFSGKYSAKDSLAGPDEASAKISYDFGPIGGMSLNGLRRGCRNDMSVGCFSGYVAANQATRQNPGAFSFAVTWSTVRPWDVVLPDAVLDVDAEDKAVATLAWDQPLLRRLGEDGKTSTVISKLVVNGSYLQWLSDNDKNDRGLLEATYIHRVSDTTSAAIGLVWANRPEYLAEKDVDHEFSAKVGLNLRVGKVN
jgi:hypothetical protein